MSTFSGDLGPEEEDGGGWGGLVPSKAERKAMTDKLSTDLPEWRGITGMKDWGLRECVARAEKLYYGTYPVDEDGFIEALDSEQILDLMVKFGQAAFLTTERREEIARRVAEYFLEGETKTRIAHHAQGVLAIINEVLCEHDWRGIDTGRMCAKCGVKETTS